MATIECRGITKIYQKKPAVNSVDIDMADGEFVVIVGPSGCGKSSLLRMVAGLEEITEGTVSIGGKVVNDMEPKERDIAMVFQNYALYPHMTVYGNMAYGLKNRRTPKDEIKRRIDNAVNVMQLDPEMLTRKPRQLSGGQRQRVAMGRAIVREPQAFLFDEPLSNLDAKLRVQMRIEIQRLHDILNVTTLYVTHDQVEAMTLAQRLVVMNNGQVEQIGTPNDIYSRPASEFVATFIGSPSMNLLEGRISDGGTRVQISDDLYWPLPLPMADADGEIVTVGVRPEHLSETTDAADAQLSVELVENLGADTLVYGQLAGKPMITRLLGTSTVKAGDTLAVKPTDSDVLHLFDRDSGRRLEPAGSEELA